MSIEARSIQYNSVLGGWHIERLLGTGSGGRTAVFSLFRDNSGWREYSVLKVINLIEEWGSVESLQEYRRKEYTAAVWEQKINVEREMGLMNHLRNEPGIVNYIDYRFFDWSDNTGFGVDLLIRMEPLTNLRSQLQMETIFSEAEIIKISKDLCRALIACHEKNMLHRNIKPENIFFNANKDFLLGDFGISAIVGGPSSRVSTANGTPKYWAPEQSEGSYDNRTDIYSLGLVLYELANEGRLPFAATGYIREAEIQQRMSGTPLPALDTVSPKLSNVILTACAYDPDDRYQSAAEFYQELEKLSSSAVPTRSSEYIPQNISDTELAENIYSEIADNTNYDGTGQNDHDLRKEQQPKKKSSKAGVIILAVFGALLLAVLLFMLLSSGGNKEDPDPKDTSTADTAPVQTQAPLPQATTQAPTEAPSINYRELMTQAMSPTDLIGAGGRQTTVILPNGMAKSAGDQGSGAYGDVASFGAANTYGWNDLKSVSSGDHFTLGLRCDGTLVAVGHNHYGQCNIYGWTDIEAAIAGDCHTVAIRRDGTLLATGWNEDGQCNVHLLAGTPNNKPMAVAAGYRHTVVLYEDGTVKAIGGNNHGQCNVSSWTDIIAVYAGANYTVGLRADGTVVACGRNDEGQCNVGGWTNVVTLCAGDTHTVALTADGKILSTGRSVEGQLNFSGWTGNIIAINAGRNHTVAITDDGRILATGENIYGQCNIVWYTYE